MKKKWFDWKSTFKVQIFESYYRDGWGIFWWPIIIIASKDNNFGVFPIACWHPTIAADFCKIPCWLNNPKFLAFWVYKDQVESPLVFIYEVPAYKQDFTLESDNRVFFSFEFWMFMFPFFPDSWWVLVCIYLTRLEGSGGDESTCRGFWQVLTSRREHWRWSEGVFNFIKLNSKVSLRDWRVVKRKTFGVLWANQIYSYAS